MSSEKISNFESFKTRFFQKIEYLDKVLIIFYILIILIKRKI